MKLFVFSCTLCVFSVFGLEPASYWNDNAQDALKEIMKRKLNTNVAKNVILFLGDGMGVSTVTGIRIKKGQDIGLKGDDMVLPFESFPYVALAKTYNTDAQTADSAGTATAYLNGVKTKYGVVGLDDTVTRSQCGTQTELAKVTSILDWSEAAGKSTGIVTTARVTHASPAATYANSVERDWENDSDMPSNATGVCKDIAAQLFEKGKNIEVVMGGGRRSFMNKNTSDPEYPGKTGERDDGRDLIQEWTERMKDKRFNYVWNKNEFDAVDPSKTDHLLGLFEPSHMQYVLDRDEAKEPSLVEMTEKAINILKKNEKGFFLFVEGGRIDHGHHDGKAAYALSEGTEFSDAITKALDMVDVEETLVVVTADHSHVFTIGGYAKRGTPILGLVDTVDIGKTNYADDGKPYTMLLYGNGPGHGQPRQNIAGVNTTGDKNYEQQTAVPLKSETHGAEDVAIYATGPMAHLFTGVQEQSYIAHAMAYASCVGANKDHCQSTYPTKPPNGAAPRNHNMIVTFLLALLCSLY